MIVESEGTATHHPERPKATKLQADRQSSERTAEKKVSNRRRRRVEKEKREVTHVLIKRGSWRVGVDELGSVLLTESEGRNCKKDRGDCEGEHRNRRNEMARKKAKGEGEKVGVGREERSVKRAGRNGADS